MPTKLAAVHLSKAITEAINNLETSMKLSLDLDKLRPEAKAYFEQLAGEEREAIKSLHGYRAEVLKAVFS